MSAKNKKLHIVIASHYLPPHPGGIEMVAYQQAKRLAARGHRVSSLSTKVKHYTAVPVHARHSISTVKAWNGLEKRGVPFPVCSPRLVFAAFRLVKKADVVHVHDVFYQTSLACALAARWYKKPLYVTQHVGMVHHSSPLVLFVQKLVYSTSGRFVWKSAQKIFTLNDTVTAFVKSFGIAEHRIKSTMNGVDTELFHPVESPQKKTELRKKYQLPERKKLVLFVGRLVPKKGYQLLKENPDYVLVFAGSGSAPQDFKTSKHVINLGSMQQESLAEVYRACDVFVLPSVGEGFPLSVQEAMACGLPVITSNDKGYKKYDLNPLKIKLVRPTQKAVQKAISEVVHMTDAKRRHMVAYGRDYAEEHFSWDELIETMLGEYQKGYAR